MACHLERESTVWDLRRLCARKPAACDPHVVALLCSNSVPVLLSNLSFCHDSTRPRLAAPFCGRCCRCLVSVPVFVPARACVSSSIMHFTIRFTRAGAAVHAPEGSPLGAANGALSGRPSPIVPPHFYYLHVLHRCIVAKSRWLYLVFVSYQDGRRFCRLIGRTAKQLYSPCDVSSLDEPPLTPVRVPVVSGPTDPLLPLPGHSTVLRSYLSHSSIFSLLM